jgi:type IV pilus assembly protein PilY1
MTRFAHISLTTIALGFALGASAATTDISNSPLEMGATTSVKPNIMLLFDDSGSMAWDFMPDWIGPSPLPGSGVDKPRCSSHSGSSCTPNTTTGLQGDPPYYAYQFNGVYYNPNVYYPPGVTYAGATMTSYTTGNSSGWTRVPNDAYGTVGGTINLLTGFPEAVFCNSSTVLPLYINCKRNGIDTGNKFLYNLGSATNGYPDAVLSGSGSVTVNLNGSDTIKITSGSYEFSTVFSGNPFFYTITPAEYCSDANLTTCTLSTSATGSYVYSASIRYCYSASDQNSLSAVTGTFTPGTGALKGLTVVRCQKKYNQRLGYQYPRFGYFNRNDIVPAQLTYTRSVARTDCALAPTCSYAEEMTNFANWYAYYHTRIQMAKSAVGLAFNTLTSAYRVGFLTINAYSSGSLNSNMFEPINDFTTTQKQNFYTDFYKLSANNGTPLREALSRVGQYYAGLTGAGSLSHGMINSTNYPDPVQYSCQQNFTIMTTDGYWNGNAGQDLSGNSIDYNTANGNQDNDSTNSFEQRASTVYGPGGYYDGNLSNTTFNGQTYTSKGTLSDVAMYYYKTDLRPSGSKNYNTGVDVGTDNVPTAQYVDQNPQQHMVTYTVGLGVDGYLTYDTTTTNPSYLSQDYLNIVSGNVGGCVWTPGTICDWPQVPTGTGYNDDPAKDDDLWHAAINGRGSYLSAKNPQSLLRGLARDLATIQAQAGAAAAAATSAPTLTYTNDFVYISTFRTAYWDGDIGEYTYNITTKTLGTTAQWSAASNLITQVSAGSDTRNIYTLSSGSMVSFIYGSLDATAKGYFDNKCSVLSQCSTLVASDQVIVNSGANLINYLRGQSQYADGNHFRSRTDTNSNITNVLGDLVDSTPTVVNAPDRAYADAAIAPGNQTYAAFAAANASRQSVLYIGGNDGMLHAFNATTGAEMWAYIPRMVLSRMYLLSDIAYPTQHQFYVDGSPSVYDVLSSADGLWHTLLIVGLNAGGRGYVAFDVTNPASPKLLWEFCNDSTVCSHSDVNLGLSFGNPVVAKRYSDGKWVVLLTSGYNNVSNGDGMGHLYELDPFSGAILQQISTGVGSTTTPSGLAKISAWVNDPNKDNTVQYVYGGDLQGNLWRFNLGGPTMAVSTMATLLDAASKPQPITTQPELGTVNNANVIYVGTGRLLGVTDLQDPATLTPPGNWSYQSSLYALVDNGSNLGNPRANATIVKQTISSSSATQFTITNNAVSIPTNIGWYIDFPATGERVNVNPYLGADDLTVATNIPNSSACSAGGDSVTYDFNPITGSSLPNTAGIVGTKTVGAEIVGITGFNTSATNGSGGTGGTQGPGGATGTGKLVCDNTGHCHVDSNSNLSNTTVRRVGWRQVPLQ